ALNSLPARYLFNGVTLGLVTWTLPGIQMPGGIAGFLLVTGVFSLISDLVRCVGWLLTCPLVLVTLGPLKVLQNMLILILTAWLSSRLGTDFKVDDLMSVFWAALLVSAVRFILTESARLYDAKRSLRRQRRWIEEMERARVWLAEQIANWRRLAEQREQLISEQEAWIEELQRAKTWLGEQRDHWRRIAER
ncbi:MAG: phage holin family protein, partial [Candidatus Binatia bacterium]